MVNTENKSHLTSLEELILNVLKDIEDLSLIEKRNNGQKKRMNY